MYFNCYKGQVNQPATTMPMVITMASDSHKYNELFDCLDENILVWVFSSKKKTLTFAVSASCLTAFLSCWAESLTEKIAGMLQTSFTHRGHVVTSVGLQNKEKIYKGHWQRQKMKLEAKSHTENFSFGTTQTAFSRKS